MFVELNVNTATTTQHIFVTDYGIFLLHLIIQTIKVTKTV